MSKHVAIYVRVSSRKQDHRSQLPDLERFAKSCGPVRWYRDKQSGRTMDRPAWNKLEAAMQAGKVSKVVCWRLDRLGRTAAGLTALFAELQARHVGLVSIKDSVDLSTPSGRLMAHVLASVAAYENEVRGENVRAGQAKARKRGKTWGGSKRGWRREAIAEKIPTIKKLHREGEPVASIARQLGVSRPTVYSVLAT